MAPRSSSHSYLIRLPFGDSTSTSISSSFTPASCPVPAPIRQGTEGSQVKHSQPDENGRVMSEKARILVVDDEPNITELVSMALRYEGFDVDVAADGRTALTRAQTFRPHLMVLDVMLPDLDGFGVLRRIRADGQPVSVVFLTARDATEDKVNGLTLGGDDYVTKPFSVEELVARVRAVLRRSNGGGPGAGSSRLTFADLELDEDTREVWRGDEAIE